MKSSKVKLDEETPVPSFFAYSSHHVNVFAKNILSIVNDGKAQKYGCTKADDLRLNKHWEYMIKKNRKKV